MWKHRLTHREVGINLDMFAPGHIGISPKWGRSYIIEASSRQLIHICYENVFMEYVADSSQIEAFFLDKVRRFNSCMGRLNLHYYFEWFWQPPNKHIEVERVMKSESPPDELWYRKNYYFINCHTIQGLSFQPMSFCSHDTQHDRHWHIIRMIYDWVLMHKRKGGDKYYKDVEKFSQSSSRYHSDQ